jgi:hypothetical protein
MPGEHAVLSPSSAERWIECPGSVALTRNIPEGPESLYAHEGTVAHELAFLKASRHFGKITSEQFIHRRAAWRKENADLLDRDEIEVEMERHTDAYVDLIEREMALHHNSQLMLEQRLDSGVPGCWGTTDASIVSPTHVETIDFKYGAGVAVEARGNPQLRLYACGVLDTYGDMLGVVKEVRITVHQPRMDHVLTDVMTPEALREWRDTVATPAAEEALSDDAHFGPSESACRWCPASGRCAAQLEAVFAEPFVEPGMLSPDEIADAKNRLPLISVWMNALEETALNMAYSEGTPIPGYKVVLSGGKRSISDQAAAVQHLIEEHGYATDEVAKLSLRGIGELEKLMGKEKFAELLKPYINPPVGRPALVPESDKRPAVAPNSQAAIEFAKEDLL